MLGKQLLDMLCCPACRGDLRYSPVAGELLCPKCRLAYAVKDDIPVMLIDEARKMAADEGDGENV
ncbi:MAG: hypothetical protein ACD_47C00641G0001 [uncultured bacterium]|uniref:UPF0434 protein A2008_04925 n=1 Tax=Candidatus Wallbacteria bacterium GWC2_49_35 TaxID=1817813 RepID=A0A1F7WVJ4_9BACT|nr:MAG: hypothetical protein ACD_47C00641G0001 [uncultured bacterium]OGM06158.1 MAG: tetraacyldisaccharide 4'-kinase [Candidatus Wallbacteria bacterium GWC2_49_35]HBC76104.1 tetraacyldisaccharide 4'-kinase [Candidatus Wallbacteria bacterium]